MHPYPTRFLLALLCLAAAPTFAQQRPAKATDTTTPLHLLKPDYPVPYGIPKPAEVKQVLDRVFTYLDATTPAELVNQKTGAAVTSLKQFSPDVVLKPGDFRLTSYEWGVTYSGMLLAGQITGDKRYTDYTFRRLKLLAELTPYYRAYQTANPQVNTPVRSVLTPHALDDAGAICAAMIKAQRAGAPGDLRPIIDNFITYITTKEYRLPEDGTLARNRPQPNTLWLDDLYMSVPALAQMGKLTGEQRYYDEAVKQVTQSSQRLFDRQKGFPAPV